MSSRVMCVVLAAALMQGSCGNPPTASTPPPPAHPGAINQTDSNLYDALLSAQAALDQAKEEYANLTVDKKKVVGPTLNKVIAAYNTAQDGYKLYHSGAANADPTQIQLQINQVIADVAGLIRQIEAK